MTTTASSVPAANQVGKGFFRQCRDYADNDDVSVADQVRSAQAMVRWADDRANDDPSFAPMVRAARMQAAMTRQTFAPRSF